MAGQEGFEPPLVILETTVLPLKLLAYDWFDDSFFKECMCVFFLGIGFD